jgi:hypothetical protein
VVIKIADDSKVYLSPFNPGTGNVSYSRSPKVYYLQPDCAGMAYIADDTYLYENANGLMIKAAQKYEGSSFTANSRFERYNGVFICRNISGTVYSGYYETEVTTIESSSLKEGGLELRWMD